MTGMATRSADAYVLPDIGIADFEAADFDPERFTHEAHVYVAWCYLRENTLCEAIARFSAALKRVTGKFGLESKYHETITWFFMIVVAERLGTTTTDGWHAFRAENADLVTDSKTLLARHYSRERLSSPLARRLFLLPDRAPLPQGTI